MKYCEVIVQSNTITPQLNSVIHWYNPQKEKGIKSTLKKLYVHEEGLRNTTPKIYTVPLP